MNLEPIISLRITGIVIFLSVVLPILLIIVISRGDFSGFQATMKGIEGVGESVSILRKTLPLAPLTVVLTLGGFGMLTLLLRQAGDNGISLLAFNLMLFSQVFIIFQGTFHGAVTVWGANELANTGSVPELFHPMWRWMYSGVQQIYVYMGLLALAAFGWAILQTGLLPIWLGWSLIGWSALWLILFLIAGDNLPLVLVVPPIVMGITAFVVDSG